jgi:hypothetical protein
MTFDQAMHTNCEACGKDAGHHRLTDAGNFYCLIPSGWIAKSTAERSDDSMLYLQNRAKCSELQKSPLTKGVAAVILEAVRGIRLNVA